MPIEILMPALSPTMTEGNLAKWVKKEGDKIKAGEVIAEIETDKATMEVEAVDEGTLGKIIVPQGTQNVQVNQVIALLLEDGEDAAAIKNYKPAAAPKAEVKEEPKQAAAPAQQAQASQAPAKQQTFSAPPVFTPPPVSNAPIATSNKDAKASPLAKRLAKESGIDIGSLVGTGPRGRIIKADIEDAVRSGGTSGRVMRNPVEYSAMPNDNMRKVIASRLLQSKQYVPHFYLSVDCNLDKLMDVRKDLNDAAFIDIESGKPAYKLSVNDLMIKAVGKALKKIPAANATWTDDAILLYNNVDVSVAVAIDGGLITPIIRNADQKSLPAISNEMKDLAARAKQGKLAPSEFQGGGFSISNLGMYGIKNFNAIINPPQACILAIGAGEMRPIVKDGAIVAANMVTVTLSCDHRAVDGAVGAEFLAAFKDFVERPVMMLV
jgi:pyruvate dehydrogenase E2 component (dihydrolipoamide acetyltransferase)